MIVDPSMKVVASITIRVWDDESMTIEGPLADPVWCLHALDHATQTVREQIRKNRDPLGLAIPGKDTSLPTCMVKP